MVAINRCGHSGSFSVASRSVLRSEMQRDAPLTASRYVRPRLKRAFLLSEVLLRQFQMFPLVCKVGVEKLNGRRDDLMPLHAFLLRALFVGE